MSDYSLVILKEDDASVSVIILMVLVGAPEAQTTQPGVTRGGAVYRCDISRDDSCQEVPFDTTESHDPTQKSPFIMCDIIDFHRNSVYNPYKGSGCINISLEDVSEEE
ncbi:hypothetical protein M8J75_004965 [Diaphorina citri]|nr:hypothetical protein M8J75_004965 [Diaphorina citri]